MTVVIFAAASGQTNEFLPFKGGLIYLPIVTLLVSDRVDHHQVKFLAHQLNGYYRAPWRLSGNKEPIACWICDRWCRHQAPDLGEDFQDCQLKAQLKEALQIVSVEWKVYMESACLSPG